MSVAMKVKDLAYCEAKANEAYNDGDYVRGEYWCNEASRLRAEMEV